MTCINVIEGPIRLSLPIILDLPAGNGERQRVVMALQPAPAAHTQITETFDLDQEHMETQGFVTTPDPSFLWNHLFHQDKILLQLDGGMFIRRLYRFSYGIFQRKIIDSKQEIVMKHTKGLGTCLGLYLVHWAITDALNDPMLNSKSTGNRGDLPYERKNGE
ncbi:hypothetical protein PO909_020974 [Leuciscus waleckii]